MNVLLHPTENDSGQESPIVDSNGSASSNSLFEGWGETEQTALFFEELMGVAEEARTLVFRFIQLLVRVAEAQPVAEPQLDAIRASDCVGG